MFFLNTIQLKKDLLLFGRLRFPPRITTLLKDHPSPPGSSYIISHPLWKKKKNTHTISKHSNTKLDTRISGLLRPDFVLRIACATHPEI